MDSDKSDWSATILCVDDVADNLMIRKMMLQSLGYRVLTATSPSEALSAIEAEGIELVLLDFRFPGHPDGEWLAKQIRAKRPNVRLVMLSGFPDVPGTAKESVDAFLVKGAEPMELRATLERLLGSSGKRPSISEVLDDNVKLRNKAKEAVDAARRS